ncbi:hypothetical protein GCM10017744_072530 [Streptomyces antimycoticus]
MPVSVMAFMAISLSLLIPFCPAPPSLGRSAALYQDALLLGAGHPVSADAAVRTADCIGKPTTVPLGPRHRLVDRAQDQRTPRVSLEEIGGCSVTAVQGSGGERKYQRIANELKAAITAGEYRPVDRRFDA